MHAKGPSIKDLHNIYGILDPPCPNFALNRIYASFLIADVFPVGVDIIYEWSLSPSSDHPSFLPDAKDTAAPHLSSDFSIRRSELPKSPL